MITELNYEIIQDGFDSLIRLKVNEHFSVTAYNVIGQKFINYEILQNVDLGPTETIYYHKDPIKNI